MNYITVLDTRDILIRNKFKNKMFNAEKLYYPPTKKALLAWIATTQVCDIDIPILKKHDNWVLFLPDYCDSALVAKYPGNFLSKSTAQYKSLIRKWADENQINVQFIPFYAGVEIKKVKNKVYEIIFYKDIYPDLNPEQITTLIEGVYVDGDVVIDTYRNIFVTQAILQRGWETISASIV